MNSSLVPATCSLVLATLSGTALSHWWSRREFAASITTLHACSHAQPTQPTQPTQPAPASLVASQAATPVAAEKEFFESLLHEMKQLKQANLALHDQMAETNRDLLQLEFRVDTQSASFRPLPVTESISSLDTSSLDTSDTDPGVLPSRAVMVGNPN